MTTTGWHPDPYGRHELRYFDGSWTSHVADGGEASVERAPASAAPTGPVLPTIASSSVVQADRSPTRLTRLRLTKYLGSHPKVSGQVAEIDVVFTTDGIEFRAGRELLGELPWGSIHELAADTREGVEKRLTATRLLLFGAIAFLAKKETNVAYLVIRDGDGDWVFAVPNLTAIELRSGLVGLQKYVPTRPAPALAAPPSAGAPPSAADRLEALADLHRRGLIEDHEYAERRRVIIESL